MQKSGEHSLAPENAWVADVINEHLNDQVKHLNSKTTADLSMARHRALAQLKAGKQASEMDSSSRSLGWFNWPLAGSGFAAAMALVVALFILKLLPATLPPSDASLESGGLAVLDFPDRSIEDMHMLSASDELEFFQTIELLEWIESNSG